MAARLPLYSYHLVLTTYKGWTPCIESSTTERQLHALIASVLAATAMSSTATVDMTPKDLINQDGNYVLQQDDMYAVLQYVWAGVLLPTSPDAFQARLGVSDDTMKKLNAVLESLISQYKTVSNRSAHFLFPTH